MGREMSIGDFLRNLKYMAPNLSRQVGGMALWPGIRTICERVGYPSSNLVIEKPERAFYQIWQHIVDSGFHEQEIEVAKLIDERELALPKLAGQIKAVAEKRQLLLTVLTRQIQTLSNNRVTEALEQIDADHRTEIGWSSW